MLLRLVALLSFVPQSIHLLFHHRFIVLLLVAQTFPVFSQSLESSPLVGIAAFSSCLTLISTDSVSTTSDLLTSSMRCILPGRSFLKWVCPFPHSDLRSSQGALLLTDAPCFLDLFSVLHFWPLCSVVCLLVLSHLYLLTVQVLQVAFCSIKGTSLRNSGSFGSW